MIHFLSRYPVVVKKQENWIFWVTYLSWQFDHIWFHRLHKIPKIKSLSFYQIILIRRETDLSGLLYLNSSELRFMIFSDLKKFFQKNYFHISCSLVKRKIKAQRNSSSFIESCLVTWDIRILKIWLFRLHDFNPKIQLGTLTEGTSDENMDKVGGIVFQYSQ